jgi:3-dehydroquinate dehydratase I
VPSPRRIGRFELGIRPCLIAAGGEVDLDALATAADAGHADVIELRADLFAAPTPERIATALERLARAGHPLLLTVRAAAEGGQPMGEPLRQSIYGASLPLVDAIDVELASTALRTQLVPRAHDAGKAVLLSHHDFAGTPPLATLRALATAAFAAGADIAKLATTAHTLDDVQRLLTATLELREHGIATLAMGAVGTLSRVFFGAAGSLLTYGCVGAPTAPGQLPIAELATLVRRFFPPAA